MLNDLQDHLADLNQADPGYNVRDFLITDPALAKCLSQGSLVPDSRETVLVAANDGELELSVFIDDELLRRLEGHNPLHRLRARQLADLWTVLEGISHFNYIAWCAGRDKAITLFELEMQAEVDKFASTLLLALEQNKLNLADRIHSWLFDQVSFNPSLTADQHERYRAANAIAARFCHGLRERLNRSNACAVQELRHFYRLNQPEKISHIHRQTWKN